ncbi:MAG: type IV toxin-antitoxin system AbiEi family antitoxin, partial [Atribacterota bacterium]|nr:type IV toxin-antitoxin system AbiEi family antitoxin [Atribacterota bacterium]
KNYSYQKNKVKNFYSLDDVGILEKRLAEYFKKKNIIYGFTITSGASRIAPFLRYKRIFVFVKNEIVSIAKDLNLKEVSTGANVSLLEPYDEGIFYNLQNINGVKIVSDVQLYLDLHSYKERGEEAARFLLDQKLRKQW